MSALGSLADNQTAPVRYWTKADNSVDLELRRFVR